MKHQNSHYSQSEGMKLVESAVQELGPVFTLERLRPIAEQQGLSAKHLLKLISKLDTSGRIEILKRGTYAVKSPLFAGEIPPFAVAAALVQPMAISHWSALAQHGFTTQLPSMVQASTPRKVITPEMRNGKAHRPRGRAVWKALGLEFEFIHVQERQFFGHQPMWVDTWQQVSITDPQRTALDLIARPDLFGGMSAAIEILEANLTRVEIPGLVAYALRYNVGAVIKRLGWLLERLGIPANELNDLQSHPVKTYYRLDPQSPAGRQYNSRWHILENLKKNPNA
jgi:predicted transcriptional regulator of viral defense system